MRLSKVLEYFHSPGPGMEIGLARRVAEDFLDAVRPYKEVVHCAIYGFVKSKDGREIDMIKVDLVFLGRGDAGCYGAVLQDEESGERLKVQMVVVHEDGGA